MPDSNSETQRSSGERLQKVMAHAGIASRRTCEEYITAGRVRVNGRVVTELGTRVNPDTDRIEFDGEPITSALNVYYALYKPVGVVSTASDPEGRPTVLDLAPTKQRLYPVGRLDLDSEGLILLTNDGLLTQHLLHPSHEQAKEYLAMIYGELTPEQIASMREGIMLEDEERPVHASARKLHAGWRWRGDPTPRGCTWAQITLHEGRKRQIRRMFATFDLPVRRLIRVRVAGLRLGDLEPGKGRWLHDDEVAALYRQMGLRMTERERGAHRGKDSHRHRRSGGRRQEHGRRRPRR